MRARAGVSEMRHLNFVINSPSDGFIFKKISSQWHLSGGSGGEDSKERNSDVGRFVKWREETRTQTGNSWSESWNDDELFGSGAPWFSLFSVDVSASPWKTWSKAPRFGLRRKTEIGPPFIMDDVEVPRRSSTFPSFSPPLPFRKIAVNVSFKTFIIKHFNLMEFQILKSFWISRRSKRFNFIFIKIVEKNIDVNKRWWAVIDFQEFAVQRSTEPPHSHTPLQQLPISYKFRQHLHS